MAARMGQVTIGEALEDMVARIKAQRALQVELWPYLEEARQTLREGRPVLFKIEGLEDFFIRPEDVEGCDWFWEE